MSNSTPNKLLKTKRKRLTKDKLESQSSKSGDFEGDEDNIEDNKQENSLGQLTRNFLQYIKKKGRVNININDLVKDLNVKKRRIYDITNVLQGIGYIEKNGKNEIIWTKSYNNQTNISNMDSVPENYLSNYNNLKQKLEELKKEDKEIEDELNKYREEFNDISKKKDFPKYGYITFDDMTNLSKNDKLDFMIIKATKGTVINVIDDEESKKAYTKIETQMKNGKIQKNDKLLLTLKNLHHIFFTTQDEKLRIYRVEKGELSETLKMRQNCAEKNNNKNIILNNSLISNNSNNNNNNYGEQKNLINIKNNIIFKEKESISKKTLLDIKENLKKTKLFNFDKNNYLSNYPPPSKINEKDIKIIDNNYNSSGISAFKKNNTNNFFTFSNEHQSPSNNYNTLFNNINKNLNNNDKNEDINENKNNYIGLSSMFKQK